VALPQGQVAMTGFDDGVHVQRTARFRGAMESAREVEKLVAIVRDIQTLAS